MIKGYVRAARAGQMRLVGDPKSLGAALSLDIGSLVEDSLTFSREVFEKKRRQSICSRSIKPGTMYNAQTAPSNAPVVKRDKCVLAQIPVNASNQSTKIGPAASNNHVRLGVSVRFNERISG